MSKQRLRQKIDELLGNVPKEVIEIHYINPDTGEVTVWGTSPAAKIKVEEPKPDKK